MHEIEVEKDKIRSDPAKLSVLFKEMIQMCLWYVAAPPPNWVLSTFDQHRSRGNATDLSLLTHMTVEDIDRLQSVGREAQESRKQFILHDDQVRASWSTRRLPSLPKVVNLGSSPVLCPNLRRREARPCPGQCRI